MDAIAAKKAVLNPFVGCAVASSHGVPVVDRDVVFLAIIDDDIPDALHIVVDAIAFDPAGGPAPASFLFATFDSGVDNALTFHRCDKQYSSFGIGMAYILDQAIDLIFNRSGVRPAESFVCTKRDDNEIGVNRSYALPDLADAVVSAIGRSVVSDRMVKEAGTVAREVCSEKSEVAGRIEIYACCGDITRQGNVSVVF